jgi:hypothetical protein
MVHRRSSDSDTEGLAQTPSSSTSPMNATPTPDSLTTYVDMANVAQSPISEVASSRGPLGYSLKGTWTCETFVMTCRKASGAPGN